MKKLLLFFFCATCFTGKIMAQTYLPVTTTGYNVDAIAETQPVLSATSGSIDGSNNALYSYAYGQLYSSSATGLPNSGLITNGTRTWQLQPYAQNNVLYVLGSQMDSLTLSTPASYPSLSILAFATEGATTMNVKLRFTDGTTQLITGVALPDWYNSASNVAINNFDRVSRGTGNPNYAGSTPQMFYLDMPLSCVNRSKSLQRVVFQNMASGPRLCIMAVSAVANLTYTTTTTPVTCSGGTNGTASLTVGGGIGPMTYSWGTSPVQTGNMATTLPTGVTTLTITDGSSCTYTTSVTINLVPSQLPPIPIVASANPLCAGTTLTLTANGATSYTWSTGGSAATTTAAPTANAVYTVSVIMPGNCPTSGSVSINVNPAPAVTFTVIPPNICQNAAGIPLVASPSGGLFSGPGISFNTFYPGLVPAGTQTLSYWYIDANSCSTTTVVSTTVFTPTTVISFTLPSTVCMGAPVFTMNATPAGGNYIGTGVTGSSFSSTLAGVGVHTVSYTYTDAGTCSASKTLALVVNICTGIDEETANTSIYELFPNPNNGTFQLRAGSDLKLTVINELGQAVQSVQLDSYNNHQATVENLAPGIYFLTAPGQSLKQKVIVTQH